VFSLLVDDVDDVKNISSTTTPGRQRSPLLPSRQS